MPDSGATFKLGRYEIVGRIASGGMATVYRGRLDGAGGFAREFAIKVIHPHLVDEPAFEERFLDEARVASRIHHPNVVATIDIDTAADYQFLVLELIEGVTLRQLQGGAGHRFEPKEAAVMVADAARGLHALHEARDAEGERLEVVHRDLSPHNLMLDNTGRTVLIDLGLAKSRDQLGHTQTGVLCGKLPYMSPEQASLERLDSRSDLFSLGAVLFELLTGEPPFGDDHDPRTLQQLRECDHGSLSERMTKFETPPWLQAIVLRALEHDPARRYASGDSFADAIESGLSEAQVDVGAVRTGLGTSATLARRRLGGDQPAEPLPPRILPTRANEALPPTRSLRPLAFAAVGVSVVLAALAISSLMGRGPLEPATRRASDAKSLNADTPSSADEAIREAKALAPTIPDAPPAPVADPEASDTEGPGEAEPEPPRRRAAKRAPAAQKPALKRNPYREP